MYLLPTLEIGDYLFRANPVTNDEVLREIQYEGRPLFYNDSLITIGGGTSRAREGVLVISTGLPGGEVSDLQEISLLVRGRTNAQNDEILGVCENWNGMPALMRLFGGERTFSTPVDIGRRFTGLCNSVTIQPDNTIEVTAVPKFAILNYQDPYIWSDVNHQRRHPGDTWFSQLAELETTGREISL